MSKDLIKNSTIVKEEADLLLKKSDLLKVLSKYGTVFIRGSYELDLMVDGDIDIYVVNNKLNKKIAIKAFNELIERNYFRGYIFYDFVKRRKKFFPKGYYLGLKTRFKFKKWKVDIWFMNNMDKSSDKLINFVKNNIDAKTREVIIKIKRSCKDKKLNTSSHLVYLAVLRDGVRFFPEFIKYQKKIK